MCSSGESHDAEAKPALLDPGNPLIVSTAPFVSISCPGIAQASELLRSREAKQSSFFLHSKLANIKGICQFRLILMLRSMEMTLFKIATIAVLFRPIQACLVQFGPA